MSALCTPEGLFTPSNIGSEGGKGEKRVKTIKLNEIAKILAFAFVWREWALTVVETKLKLVRLNRLIMNKYWL